MKFCYSLHLLLHKSMEKGHSEFITTPLVHPVTHFRWNQNKHRTVLLRLRARDDLIRRAFHRMTLETNCTIASPGHPETRDGENSATVTDLSAMARLRRGKGGIQNNEHHRRRSQSLPPYRVRWPLLLSVLAADSEPAHGTKASACINPARGWHTDRPNTTHRIKLTAETY